MWPRGWWSHQFARKASRVLASAPGTYSTGLPWTRPLRAHARLSRQIPVYNLWQRTPKSWRLPEHGPLPTHTLGQGRASSPLWSHCTEHVTYKDITAENEWSAERGSPRTSTQKGMCSSLWQKDLSDVIGFCVVAGRLSWILGESKHQGPCETGRHTTQGRWRGQSTGPRGEGREPRMVRCLIRPQSGRDSADGGAHSPKCPEGY